MIEGGIRRPSVPEPARLPMARLRLYPRASNSGRDMRPMVAVVAADEPQTAAKIPHPATFTWRSRPGSQPSQGARPRKRISDNRARKRISPIQMNSGSAASVQEALVCQIDVAMAFSTGTLLKNVNPIHPTPSRESAIHKPEPRNRNMNRSRTKATWARSGDMSYQAPRPAVTASPATGTIGNLAIMLLAGRNGRGHVGRSPAQHC